MSRWILKDDLQMWDSGSDSVKGIVVDNSENIYFTLFGSIWKQNIEDDWNFQVLVQERGIFLEALTWDGGNTIYAADNLNHQIYQYDLNSEKLSHLAGTGEEGNIDGNVKECTFSFPTALASDNDHNLYVVQQHAIRKINLKQATTFTVAGNGLPSLHWDGPIHTARFTLAHSIALDDKGTIYVGDGPVVRQIKDEDVSTLAGKTVTSFLSRDGPTDSALFINIGAMIYDKGKLFVTDSRSLRMVDLENNIVSTECEFAVSPLCLAKNNRFMYIGTEKGILRLEESWKAERFLWLGKLKESSEHCYLAKLPKEIIKEIASHLGERKRKRVSQEEPAKKIIKSS